MNNGLTERPGNPEETDTQRGLRVIKLTFFVLVLTALAEGSITYLSGSAALLADTIHGLSNSLTTLLLWVAFALARKKPTRQFPYGYHRAEDAAGILILLFILVSAALVGYESVDKLLTGHVPDNIPWAMAAGLVGFLANEGIAQYRIRIGKQVGSAALIADGHHARVDGLGSLAVVLGLLAVMLGVPIADPVAGLVITGLIAVMLVTEVAPTVLSRLMDRIEPSVIAQLKDNASSLSGVLGVYDVRARWVGHVILAEMSIGVDADSTVKQSHHIAEQVHHKLVHSMPKLEWCTIHVEPSLAGEEPGHPTISHHFPER